MVIMMRFLAVVVSVVGVVSSTGQYIIFLTTVSLVLWVSDFLGLMSQTILTYVTFRSCGTCEFGIKNISFDTLTMLPTPCAILHYYLEKYLCQTTFSYPLTKFLYSCANPSLGYMKLFICSFLGQKIASGVTVVM